jgi:tryptophanase
MCLDEVNVEPFRIKVVEPIKAISRDERLARIQQAGYNVFRLKAEDVYIDLMTDSGTSAMSSNQWAGIMLGDESYAGCRGFDKLQASVEDVLGFKHVMPTHQGRPAENFLFQTFLKKGNVVPFNIPFDSTEANVMVNGAKPVECACDAAYDPKAEHPFKGNIDIEKLQAVIDREGTENIPLIMVTITNNTGGGQPVSMANFREIKAVADRHGIPVYFDAARCAENAYFIQKREDGYSNKPVAEIVREQFSHADGCTFSCKKDALVNIGGLICTNSEDVYNRIVPLMILYEGFVTYGGMAGRDVEALAIGLREMVEDDYIRYRVQQVEFLGGLLRDEGIPIVVPTGGHAVYIDAAAFLPHVPRSRFPADALAVEFYLEAGIRSIGLGSLAFMKEDEETGEVIYPKLELLRLAVPRRVYTDNHLRYVARAIKRVHDRKESILGMEIRKAPPVLKHFTAEMAPVRD